MEQLTEGELAMLLEACNLQVHALLFRAERAEHAVEKLNFTARAERMRSAQEKIEAELASRLESLSWE